MLGFSNPVNIQLGTPVALRSTEKFNAGPQRSALLASEMGKLLMYYLAWLQKRKFGCNRGLSQEPQPNSYWATHTILKFLINNINSIPSAKRKHMEKKETLEYVFYKVFLVTQAQRSSEADTANTEPWATKQNPSVI